ncbi:MAG: methyltransferase domain-containing protein [Deltaproteobacteria bacterium]|nr:methyltransferase domain-containing protein [Deltaproteobacteria bacterium]
MKKWLKEKLICPECLASEIPLELNVKEEVEDDVMEGELSCSACNRRYPIHNGVAVILPDKTMPVISDASGYNSKNMLSSYLWSHFADIFKDPEATEAYRVWSSFFRKTEGYALDIGCSVGRLSFELSKTHSNVVGIDTSIAFIEKARELLRNKKLKFDMIMEGLITEKRSCEFNDDWNFDRVEFIVADALAIPFPGNFFSTVTSINILEKVSSPIRHLMDINRVLSETESMFVFSDPFSWDETVSPPEHWLGGVTSGNGSGKHRGIDTVIRYLWGKKEIFNPPMEITNKGNVSWKIRKTENLWEYINSQFVVGMRK